MVLPRPDRSSSAAAPRPEPRTALRSALRDTPRLGPDARHVISRLTFGQTPELLEELAGGGTEAFVRRQLAPREIDDSACEAAVAAFGRLRRSPAELVRANEQWEVQNELIGMSVVRATLSRRQLLEVMVDFWSNHFSVNAGKFRVAYMLAHDNAALRRGALGRFDELLVTVAKSPSMLLFLDNHSNRADGGLVPNENYARELLEIHTLGNPGAYSEDDVRALAHVFSGWTIDRRDWSFTFRGDWNRLGPAAARTTLGWTPPAPQGRIENGETLLARLARDPRTARHLCHKLCRHFVRDDIGRDDAAVSALVETYLANDTDIARTLAALFAGEAFRASVGQRLKRPNELLCSMLRASGARFELEDGQRCGRRLREELARLDQVTFEAGSPKGHPYGDRAWVDASALINRWNLAFRIAGDRADGARTDISGYAAGLERAGDIVDDIALRLLGRTLPDGERRPLLERLGADSDATPIRGFARRKIAAVVGLTLASPTFQTR